MDLDPGRQDGRRRRNDFLSAMTRLELLVSKVTDIGIATTTAIKDKKSCKKMYEMLAYLLKKGNKVKKLDKNIFVIKKNLA